MQAKSTTWKISAQPRRRPPKGGWKRSMKGDHSILNVQGAWAKVIRPTMRMSTPALRIQSGMAIHTSPRGSPEENESRETDAVRHDIMA